MDEWTDKMDRWAVRQIINNINSVTCVPSCLCINSLYLVPFDFCEGEFCPTTTIKDVNNSFLRSLLYIKVMSSLVSSWVIFIIDQIMYTQGRLLYCKLL